jgi:hypothetical protein
MAQSVVIYIYSLTGKEIFTKKFEYFRKNGTQFQTKERKRRKSNQRDGDTPCLDGELATKTWSWGIDDPGPPQEYISSEMTCKRLKYGFR